MQSSQRLFVVIIDSYILTSQLFLKACLVVMHVFHKIFIILFLFSDQITKFSDLLLALINFIVWHIDSTKDIRVLFGLVSQSRLWLNDLRSRQRTSSQVATKYVLVLRS